jgi:hypothetical protein
MQMDSDSIVQYIVQTFADVDPLVASDDYFFIYDPGRRLPPERKFPFATLVTADRHDQFSNLDREGVYRLNIGVSGETYRSMFGPAPRNSMTEGLGETDHDFTATDTLMPHPVYASMHWICILNPTAETFEQQVKPLLAEAYDRAVGTLQRRNPATDS